MKISRKIINKISTSTTFLCILKNNYLVFTKKCNFLEGIVAHAFYPPVGALHFDADENWTLNQSKGINFFQVCLAKNCFLIVLAIFFIVDCSS